jgi:coenzyme PQQ precursor peptide PqqA
MNRTTEITGHRVLFTSRLMRLPGLPRLRMDAARTPPPARLEECPMAWKKPRVTEICLGMEINCYASAKV